MRTALPRRDLLQAGALLPLLAVLPAGAAATMQGWKLATSRTTGIHDVAPAPDGGVWFTAQASGHLGWFEPSTGRTELVALGRGASPHGVVQGPDKAAWITDGGQNAIVRVSWPDRKVQAFPLPAGTPWANLNTCAIDGAGDVWFTGQSGFVGKVAVKTGEVSVREAPRGRGPYGICATPSGDVWWCSLAGSFIARIDRATGTSAVVEPPARDVGTRRIWSDSRGRLWVSGWNDGQLLMHDPAAGTWRTWKAPGARPQLYAVYVDERDTVWASDWGSNALLSFDPRSERFDSHPFQRPSANVRQLLGRPNAVWFGESGTEHIGMVRTG